MFNPYLSKKTRALQPYGFGITVDNAESVNFQPDDSFKLIDYTFESGDTSPIYLTTTPRMVNCAPQQGDGRDVKKGHPDEGRVVEVPQGEWDKAKHKALQRHIVFFVGKNKQLLHTTLYCLPPRVQPGVVLAITMPLENGGD